MGWPGNMVDYVENTAQSYVDSARNQFNASVQDANNATDNLGSFKYESPIAAGLSLYGGYKNDEENTQKDKDAAKAAEATYQTSLNNIGSIADYQDLISKDFSENKEKYKGLLDSSANRGLRGQLTNTLQQQGDNFNSRGLLDSGGAKFAKQSAKAKNLTDIQNSDYNNAQTIENQARDFQNTALSTRTAAQGDQTAKSISDYQTDLANEQAQNQGYNAIAQSGGQLAGSYLANQNKKKATYA